MPAYFFMFVLYSDEMNKLKLKKNRIICTTAFFLTGRTES